MREDTICAPATAPGAAGVGIIRISGPDAESVLRRAFAGKSFSPRVLALGLVCDGESIIDQAMGVFFPAPNSYTGEDMAEIQAHGSAVGLRLILELVMRLGARMAQPGEFTKRAFLNGKLDLSRAEAVAEYISAVSEGAAINAAKRLRGGVAKRVEPLRRELTDVMAHIEAAIQYPEEEFEGDVLADLKAIADGVDGLAKTYHAGRLLRQGVRVVIAGRPNVGKSSLLNALLGFERAIVTKLPGTTRDVLEESFSYRGAPFVLTDTAGIRAAADEAERMGVERSRDAMEGADITLMLLDSSEELSAQDGEIYDRLKARPHILALSKSDLEPKTTAEAVYFALAERPIEISAVSGEGVSKLLDELYNKTIGKDAAREDVLIADARQFEALARASAALSDAIEALAAGVDEDCTSIDIREAWDALSQITGHGVTEEVIDRIFEKFCLGK